MKTARYQRNIPPLIDWINANYPTNACSAIDRTDAPPEPFCNWAREQLPPQHPHLNFWASKIKAGDELVNTSARNEGDWVQGFPHKHAWPQDITTLILYVQAPVAGGEFALGGYNRDDPYKLIRPEVGLAVFVDAATWHGVKPVLEGERMAVIVTGFPDQG